MNGLKLATWDTLIGQVQRDEFTRISGSTRWEILQKKVL